MKTIDPNAVKKIMAETGLGYLEARKRLKGVQGPEQGLVEESRSARQQGAAEEVEPGERDVAEIVGASELLRHIERMKEGTRRGRKSAHERKNLYEMAYENGYAAAVAELGLIVDRLTEKRSDLCNAKVVAPPPQDSDSK